MLLTRFSIFSPGPNSSVVGIDGWEKGGLPRGGLSGCDLSVTPRWIDSSAAVILESGSMEWIFMAR